MFFFIERIASDSLFSYLAHKIADAVLGLQKAILEA
jgi:hypothetical protein